MADRYWVGGTGTWNNSNTTNWSATSGGAGGASAPINGDNVFFNGSSGTGTVTVGASVVCSRIDCTGYTGALNRSSGEITLQGSGAQICYLASGMTTDGTLQFIFRNNTGHTARFFNKTVSSIRVYLGATVTLNTYGVTTTTLTIDGGASTFADGGQTVYVDTFNIPTSGSTSFYNIGSSSSKLYITGTTFNWTTGQVLNFGGTTGGQLYFTNPNAAVTITRSTGLNNIAGFSIVGSGGEQSLALNGVGGSGATHTLSLTGYGRMYFSGGGGASVGLTISGTNANSQRLLIDSANFSNVTGTHTLSNADFRSTTFNSPSRSGTSLGNCGGNTLLTQTTPVTRYFVGTGTGSWTSTANWSTTSGGAGGASMPLPQDTAIFNASSPNLTFSGYWWNNNLSTISCSGYTGTFNLSANVASYYNVTLNAGMTVTGGAWYFNHPSSNSITLTTNSATTSSVTFSTAITYLTTQGAIVLGSNLSCFSLNLLYGAGFTTNNYNVTAQNTVNCVSSTNSLGSSTFTAYNIYFPSAYTGTPNVTINDSYSPGSGGFQDGGGTGALSIGTLTLTPNSISSIMNITVTNPNFTIGTVTDSVSMAYTIRFNATRTYNIGNWLVSGSAGNVVSLRSSSAGTQYTLNKTGGGTVTAAYLDIKDSAATPSSTWYAIDSTDSGNNTGWTITAPSAGNGLFFGSNF